MSHAHLRTAAVTALALVIVTSACGDTAQDPTTTTVPPVESTTTSSPTETTVAETTTTVASTDSTEPPDTRVAAPGEPFDLWVPLPEEGPILGVVGVRFDDTLNVRLGPGTSFEVVAELPPTATGIIGTGGGWQLPDGDVWWEIQAMGTTGWVNQRFMSRLGGVEDVTELVRTNLGDVSAATMEELATAIVQQFGSDDPASEIVVVVEPNEEHSSTMLVDVLGLADDSVGGLRLRITANYGDDGYALSSVESIVLCQRGVSADGLCV